MQRVKIVTRYVKRVESYSKKKKICNLDFLYFASSQCDIYICMQHRYKNVISFTKKFELLRLNVSKSK